VYDALTNAEISTAVVNYTDSGRSWSVANGTLTARDPYATVIVAKDAAGNVTRSFPASPDGNLNADASFDISDVDLCLTKVSAFGPKVAPDYANAPNFQVLTPQQLAHGDIGPLNNGVANPDGYIDIVDCLLIVRKLNGYSVSY
jgi:hypothetical protein